MGKSRLFQTTLGQQYHQPMLTFTHPLGCRCLVWPVPFLRILHSVNRVWQKLGPQLMKKNPWLESDFVSQVKTQNT